MTTQPCNRCGRHYGPGGDEKFRHQMLNGHPPTPEKVTPEPGPTELDDTIREREAAERAARRGAR